MPWIEPINSGERGTGRPEKSSLNAWIVAPVAGSVISGWLMTNSLYSASRYEACARMRKLSRERCLELEFDALRLDLCRVVEHRLLEGGAGLVHGEDVHGALRILVRREEDGRVEAEAAVLAFPLHADLVVRGELRIDRPGQLGDHQAAGARLVVVAAGLVAFRDRRVAEQLVGELVRTDDAPARLGPASPTGSRSPACSRLTMMPPGKRLKLPACSGSLKSCHDRLPLFRLSSRMSKPTCVRPVHERSSLRHSGNRPSARTGR